MNLLDYEPFPGESFLQFVESNVLKDGTRYCQQRAYLCNVDECYCHVVRFCSSDGVRQLLGNASTIAYEDAVTVDPRCCRNQSNKKATRFPILRSDGKFGE